MMQKTKVITLDRRIAELKSKLAQQRQRRAAMKDSDIFSRAFDNLSTGIGLKAFITADDRSAGENTPMPDKTDDPRAMLENIIAAIDGGIDADTLRSQVAGMLAQLDAGTDAEKAQGQTLGVRVDQSRSPFKKR